MCPLLAALFLPALNANATEYFDSSAVNLAHWPGASMTSSTSYNADKLLLRHSTTAWICNRFAPIQWVQLDIGQQQTSINRARIVVNRYPIPDYDYIRPVGIRVLVADNAAMTGAVVAYQITNNKNWIIDMPFAAPLAGRYVRVEFSGSSEVLNCEISGLEVYSLDAKTLNPGYPISDYLSGGANITPLSGWWSLANSCGGFNLLSEKKVGNIWHIMDQAVIFSCQGEDATVRIDLPIPYDVTRVRIGHTETLGSYKAPDSVKLTYSDNDINYYELGTFPTNRSAEYTDIVATGSNGWTNLKYLKLTVPKDTTYPTKNLTRVQIFGSPSTSSSNTPSGTVVATGTTLFNVNVPEGARLSAAIYQPNGKLIRTLHALESVASGSRPVQWDGKDDFGQVVPAGTYNYRYAYSSIQPTALPSVGNNASPMAQTTSATAFVTGLATDAQGNWYQTASFDEAGKAIRQYLPDGTPGWSYNNNGSFGVAVDSDYVYVLLADIGGTQRGQYVRRLYKSNGKRFLYPGLTNGFITVNAPAALPAKLPNYRDYTLEQQYWITGANGIAVTSDSIWVSNYRENRIDRFNKTTGAVLGNFPAQTPMGIAAVADGTLWVIRNGDRVTHFDSQGNVIEEITGLNTPLGVTIGNNDGAIYITEKGTNQIRKYNPQTLALIWTRGTPVIPGPLQADAFRWYNYGAITVDQDGRYLVLDNVNQQVKRFNADGTLYQIFKADFAQPGPSVAPSIGENLLLSGNFLYQIDLQTGAWAQIKNLQPADEKFDSGSTFIRRLSNGRDYLFCLNTSNWGVAVSLIEPNGGLRRCAMFGRHWSGNDDLLDHKWIIAPFNWRDLNGDGQLQDNERETKADLSYFVYHGWVDEQGKYWYYDISTNSIKTIGVQGFDSLQNPIIDFNQRTLVVPSAQIPAGAWNEVRPSPNGQDVYLLGQTTESSPYVKNNGLYHSGGFSVARFNQGQYVGQFNVPIQFISAVTDGRFLYVGQNPDPQRVCVYTPEGLMVAELMPGELAGWARGWMDTTTPLAAIRLNGTDTHHVYTEEVAFSQLLHYRFESGGNNLQEGSGTFNWNP